MRLLTHLNHQQQRNMGGANTVKGNWVTEKKTPQALGDDNLAKNPELARPYVDLLMGGGMKQNVSLSDMIAPYYGGEETLKSEIEKAKTSSLENNANALHSPFIPNDLIMKMDYEKIGEKIPVSSSNYRKSSYSRKDKDVLIVDPQTMAFFNKEILDLEKSSDPEDVKSFNKFLYENFYKKQDLEESVENHISDFIGILEHEVGHHSAIGENVKKGPTHMDRPSELANQLGRIQREAFYLYGKRFTPETLTDFIEQQKVVPDDERFQNFSPDTRRGLRKILDLHTSPSDSDYKNYQYVKKVIPEFVKNETKPMSSYDAINAGLEENIKPTAV
jgi:hypothetical protein